MINGKSIIAIIPARGGSKRLPRKSILNLAGKPLISWTIEAAKNCSYLDEIMVTTDDHEIAKIAKQHGANVPFIRPENLADDFATSVDVVKHTIEFFRDELHREFDFIVLLQPTSPLRTTQHINEAIELFVTRNANAVISVCEAEYSPLWCNTLKEDGSMADFVLEAVKNKRSQDLPTYFRLNGAIYIIRVSQLFSEGTLLPKSNSFAYKMQNEDSIDIDTKTDFLIANALIKNRLFE